MRSLRQLGIMATTTGDRLVDMLADAMHCAIERPELRSSSTAGHQHYLDRNHKKKGDNP